MNENWRIEFRRRHNGIILAFKCDFVVDKHLQIVHNYLGIAYVSVCTVNKQNEFRPKSNILVDWKQNKCPHENWHLTLTFDLQS